MYSFKPIPRILRLPEVIAAVGLSKSSIWRLVKSAAFPQPIRLSQHAVGWELSEIEMWLEERKIASMPI